MKRTFALLLTLCLPCLFSTRAVSAPLLPEEYTSELTFIKSGTYPRQMVIKYFEAVDKGFEVAVGAPQESVYEIRYNDQHLPYRFSEYTTAGDLKEQYDRIYNAHGVVTNENKRGGDRQLRLFSEYTYDNPKQAKTMRSQKIYNGEKHLLYVENYQADKKGNISSSRRVNPKGEVIYIYEYAYDEHNNRIRETRINDKGNKVSEQEHEYGDHKDLLADNVYNSQGKLRFRNEYAYNDKGEMTEMTITHADGTVERYRMKYEYDTQGNWIRQTTYKGSKIPLYVIIRDIEY